MCALLIVMDPRIEMEQVQYALLTMETRGLSYQLMEVNSPKWEAKIGHIRLPINGLSKKYNHPIETKLSQTWMVGEYYHVNKSLTPSDTEYWARLVDQYPDVQATGMYHALRIMKDGSPPMLYQDHRGKKPLYMRFDIPSMASEIKPLTALGPCTLNTDYIERVRNGLLPLDGTTPYNEIMRAHPRYMWSWNTEISNWEPHPYGSSLIYQNEAEQDYSLPDLLSGALKRRLLATDVPVGMLLSGGLDSSILYMMSRHLGLDPEVYHIENNERIFIDQLDIPSNKLNVFNTSTISDLNLKEVMYYNESPLDLGSMVSQIQLSMAIRKAFPKLHVLISGDGADELFCGYKRAQRDDTRAYDRNQELPIYHYPKLDKLTSCFTFELRHPFLDECIFQWTGSQTYHSLKGKQPLKAIAKDIGVPESIINRSKQPLRLNAYSEDKVVWRNHLCDIFVKEFSTGLVALEQSTIHQTVH